MASNVEVSDAVIENAVVASIAGQILGVLNDEHRDAIMKKAIGEALKGFSLRQAVEKAVCQRAAEIAAELCKTEEWSERIASEIQEGFKDYLKAVRPQFTKDWRR